MSGIHVFEYEGYAALKKHVRGTVIIKEQSLSTWPHPMLYWSFAGRYESMPFLEVGEYLRIYYSAPEHIKFITVTLSPSRARLLT